MAKNAGFEPTFHQIHTSQRARLHLFVRWARPRRAQNPILRAWHWIAAWIFSRFAIDKLAVLAL
jgi:hypothetical protein